MKLTSSSTTTTKQEEQEDYWWSASQFPTIVEQFNDKNNTNNKNDRSIIKLLKELQILRQQITKYCDPIYCRNHYSAQRIFITYDTERAQRDALHILTPSKYCLYLNQLDLSRFVHFSSQPDINDGSYIASAKISEVVQRTHLPHDLYHAVTDHHINGQQQIVTLRLKPQQEHLQQQEQHDMEQDPPPDETKALLANTTTTTSIENNNNATRTKSLLNQLLRFRGNLVFDIQESHEPWDIRWLDLQVPKWLGYLQLCTTTFIIFCFMTWSAYFIHSLYIIQQKEGDESNVSFILPIFIALTNVLVPKICEAINKFESHFTDRARQASLYVKVTFFRWFNSALALLLVYGFSNTISAGGGSSGNSLSLNQMVYNLIFAEMFTIPIIKLCDFMGFIRKHILAPRAPDQETMNSYFRGAKFELAERYTDASKVLFVALFYSAILPVSLFLGAAALMIHFAQAKFSLLRMWQPAPDIGVSFSRFIQNYFFTTALVVHLVMSAYWWSGYPFDNVCEAENDNSSSFFFSCNQDFLRSGIFPPLPQFQPKGKEWMTSSQEIITSLYSWTALVLMAFCAVLFLKGNVLPWITSIFKSTYEPDGADQHITFSSVKQSNMVTAYIPTLREPGFSHPQLACDISNIDTDVIGWNDPVHDYSYHNLFHEATIILGHKPDPLAFSRIQEWPVEQQQEQQEEEEEMPKQDEQEQSHDYGVLSHISNWVRWTTTKMINPNAPPQSSM